MRTLILGILISASMQVWAHGEDKLGPHEGFISMPGAFHVELVPVKTQQLKVYLLDMEWKNPSLKDSSIEVTHASVPAQCEKKVDHFECSFPAQVNLTKPGELKVLATREKQKGQSTIYKLPLKVKSHH